MLMKPLNNLRPLQSKRRMLEDRLAAAKRLRAIEEGRFRANIAMDDLLLMQKPQSVRELLERRPVPGLAPKDQGRLVVMAVGHCH